MNFHEAFDTIKAKIINADVSAFDGQKIAYQFELTGEAAGNFYAEVKDGVLSVEPYTYDDKDVLFTVSAEDLIKIIDGNLNPVAAHTTGKLKVQGDIGKALMLEKLAKKAKAETKKTAAKSTASKTPAKATDKTDTKTTAKTADKAADKATDKAADTKATETKTTTAKKKK